MEDAKLDEKRHQVTARYVIHHKVEVVPILNVEICLEEEKRVLGKG